MVREGLFAYIFLYNLHLYGIFADGPEQRLRDLSMRPEVEGKNLSWSANQWSDAVTQWWAYE